MTVSDQIIEVLNALCEKFGLAMDWGSENVIPYVTTLLEKLINYEVWTSVASIGVCVIIAAVSAVFLFKNNIVRAMEDDDIGEILLWMFCASACLTATIIASVEIGDIIKCLTFPELYIVEYIHDLINSGS